MSKKNKRRSVRDAALDVIIAVESQASYSNLLLHHAIETNQVTKKDTGLLTELTYGTLQRRDALDYFLAPFLKGKKIDSWVQNLLRLSVYQMVYLDKIPERAIFHEAVEIAKARGHKGIAGMVNGVLRSMQREGVKSLEDIKDPEQRLAVSTSHPVWLVKRWVKQYGFDKTKEMVEVNIKAPNQTIRVNSTVSTRDEVINKLMEEGFMVEASPYVPEAIKVLKGNAANSPLFKEGYYTIQDESSMIVAHVANIENGSKVLDMCAAPGGKTTHMAEKNKEGQVISLDLHKHKKKLIDENAERLQLNNIKSYVMDGRKALETFEKESYDRVLVDAPCSGFGVMRRKPDIKYSKIEEDIHRLSAIQRELLEVASKLVKPNGLLLFSTCTVDKEENNENVLKFLKEHPEFDLETPQVPSAIQPFVEDKMLQLFPQDIDSDGFFIAALRKKG